MSIKVSTIQDVAERQLCCGCGACAYISSEKIRMVDTLDYGRRPLVQAGSLPDPKLLEAMRVCPGIELCHTFDRSDPTLIPELIDGWGPVREVWEGYAADPAIRFAGSSGGAATALALYCIERAGMYGVLHTAARSDIPYLNHTVLSRTRADLLAATGSRYAPASPCDGMRMIEEVPAPCVFIGKPCDVAGTDKARQLRPQLDLNVGLTIGIFCAGTPTTRGTLALLRRMGVDDPTRVVSLRYRGNGWPGRTVVRLRTPDGEEERELTYEQSWGEVLTNHKQWRCNLCPDHTGEFADISVGDPWHRKPEPGESGRSLVLVRTEKGQRFLRDAIRDSFVVFKPADPAILPIAQSNLLKARGAVWGRLLALWAFGIPRPVYQGMRMLPYWFANLSFFHKIQSSFGAIKRIHTRHLARRHPVAANVYRSCEAVTSWQTRL